MITHFIGLRKLLISQVLVFFSLVSWAQDRSKDAAYQLVWSDEFDVDGRPDSAKWTFENGFERNHEDQWYQPENAWCEDGKLIIEARQTDLPNPLYEAGSKDWRKARERIHYTSSCLLTKGLHQWKYGRFEMRGRIDIQSGIWPAWWTLGVAKPWPANGEIDIMEYYRGEVLANIACKGLDGAEWYSKKVPVDSLGGDAWSKAFHVWRMDWDRHGISLYLDDALMNRVSLDKLVNKDGTGFEPFKQAHYMLLNLALGGDNGGDLSATVFPRRFEVDYVRMYNQSR